MFGVPPRGAFDRESLQLANVLVGNEPETPALELTMATAAAVATGDLYVSLVGSGDSRALPLKSGERLQIKPGTGARCYLAVRGGWVGTLSERITAGNLPTRRNSTGSPKALASPPDSLRDRPIRILPGPAAEHGFTDLTRATLQVRLDSDRVGVRLDGLKLPTPPEQTSEPTSPGAIQVTRDGTPILLGPDGPTIGGYPVIAHVISADLDRVGQLPPGAQVTFEMVTHEQSQAAFIEREERLIRTLKMLRLA